MHPSSPTAVHSSSPTAAVHAAEAAPAVHTATAEAAATVTTTTAAAAATPESRLCESKRRGDHASNEAIKRPVVHPIPPLLKRSGQSRRRRSGDPIHPTTSND
jgi:hypothetical protein